MRFLMLLLLAACQPQLPGTWKGTETRATGRYDATLVLNEDYSYTLSSVDSRLNTQGADGCVVEEESSGTWSERKTELAAPPAGHPKVFMSLVRDQVRGERTVSGCNDTSLNKVNEQLPKVKIESRFLFDNGTLSWGFPLVESFFDVTFKRQ